MSSTTSVLSDDHIDLLISAALEWGVLTTSKTRAAFAGSVVEQKMVVATATEAGQLIRAENMAAVEWSAAHGCARPADRASQPHTYSHRQVEHLVPIEVIKAAHATQSACSVSPTWDDSVGRRLIAAVITAATQRLDGYADAPWLWTRSHRRTGRSIGISHNDDHPQIPGLTWLSLDAAREHWTTAPLVILTPAAAANLQPDLAARQGVFVLVVDEDPNQVWSALSALDMQALVLFWPTCQTWLTNQLADPAPEFAEHRDAM